jgi:SAM-dependent methyltransferase
MMSNDTTAAIQAETFFREYTSPAAVAKYSSATAGCGINYLLDDDYKEVYLKSLRLLPVDVQQRGIRILEFGCGAGMNLLHLVSLLIREGINVTSAAGTDFSPVLIETAKREAKSCLPEGELRKFEFHVAKTESIMSDLSTAARIERSSLENSFHFVLGVNTIRYCHTAKTEMDSVRAIFNLLAPGGICVVYRYEQSFSFLPQRVKESTSLEEEAGVLHPFPRGIHRAIRQSGL